MGEWFRQLVSHTRGVGLSSSKFGWIMSSLPAVAAASFMTFWGVYVYVLDHIADPVFWGSTVGLWTASLGISSSVKKNNDNIGGKGDPA